MEIGHSLIIHSILVPKLAQPCGNVAVVLCLLYMRVWGIYRVGQKLPISICLMLNWYSFVKSKPNFIIFGTLTPEYIPNKTMHVLSTSPIACSYTTL